MLCPSYPGASVVGGPANDHIAGLSNYAGCHHDVESPIDENNNGVLFLNSHIRDKDVTDGLAHTIYIGEKLGSQWDLGWMSGTRATLRNSGTAINQTPWDEGSRNNANARSPLADLVDGADKCGNAVSGPFGDAVSAAKDARRRRCRGDTGRLADQCRRSQGRRFRLLSSDITNFLFGDGAVESVADDIDL